MAEFFDNSKASINDKSYANQMGIRAFKLKILDLFCYRKDGIENAKYLFQTASNMTEEIGSLSVILKHDQIKDEIKFFYKKWRDNANVIDKWFETQVIYATGEKAISTVSGLTKHPSFKPKNPNRFRSVIGTFAERNLLGFHQQDGKGYEFITNWLIKHDQINPQTTARICTVFDNWKVFDTKRQTQMVNNLQRLLTIPNISRNTYEIVDSILKK